MAEDGGQGRVLAAAAELARAAGELVLERRGKVAVTYKSSPVDLVTEADREAEALIVRGLQERFPGEAVWGEEGGRRPGEGDALWLVDPLDGTTNYAHGLPLYAVSVARLAGGDLDVAVVFQPASGDLFTASRGGGAWLNGRPLRVSGTARLAESLLVTGFPYDAGEVAGSLDRFGRLTRLARGVRRLGSAALDLAYVAAGWLDGYWEVALHPWDVAAGILLVREAGGRVTDLAGRPGDPFLQQVVASNGRIHQELVAALGAGADR